MVPLNPPSNNAPDDRILDADAGMALWRRMSAPLKDTIVNAQQQCLREGSTQLDPSHVFAGLMILNPAGSNGLKLLNELGVDTESLVSSLKNSGFIATETSWPPRPTAASYASDLKICPEFNALMAEAGTIATGMGHERVGTEHLLLAFMSISETYGYRVLNGFNVTAERVRIKMGEWLISGVYRPEFAAPGDSMLAVAQGGGQPGAVYQVYRLTRIGYLITIFVPLLLTVVVPSGGALPLGHYLAAMNNAIYIYIFPYVMSTYAIAFLLRTRSIKQLIGMPPLQSMVGLGLPFGLSLASGILLLFAVIPFVNAVPSIASLAVAHHGGDILAFIFCILLTLNCLATVVTHWLLTFNIRGKYVKLFG